MSSVPFAVIAKPEPGLRRFEAFPVEIRYARPEASNNTPKVPAVGGEQKNGRILERRADAMVLSFDVAWAAQFEGEWVAILTNDGTLRSQDALLRLRMRSPNAATEIDVHVDDPQRDALLDRARWLGHAWLAWRRRFTFVDRTEEPIAALTEALAHVPDAGWISTQRGRARMVIGAFEAALEDFDSALRAGEDAACDRARALLALERKADALAALEAAHDDDPAYLAWVRGLVFRANGRLEEAVAAFRVAAASTAEVSMLNESRYLEVRRDARSLLGLTLAERGEHEEAIKILGNVTGPESHIVRAQCLEALGRIDDAISRYEYAAKLGASTGDQIARLRAALPPRAANQRDITRRPARPTFAPGLAVHHRRFGTGIVRAVPPGGVTLVVEFDGLGEQTVRLEHVTASDV